MVSCSPRSSRACPPASRCRPRTSTPQLARRRLGHGRGARMSFEQDEVTLAGGVRHGRTQGGPVAIAGRQHRVAEVVDGHVRRPGRRRGPRRPGAQRAADPPAAGPRRPGRHAEVRLRRRPPGARAGQRPRDRRPRGARRGRPGVPAPGASASRSSATSSRSGRSPSPTASCPARSDNAAHRRGPGALRRPRHAASDGRGDRRRPEERRHPRRRHRGRRPRPAAGPGQPRALGPPAGLPAGRRPHGRPVGQGRRGRGRAGDRAPPGLGGPRRDRARRLRTGSIASSGSPTAPAASRAA